MNKSLYLQPTEWIMMAIRKENNEDKKLTSIIELKEILQDIYILIKDI